MRYGEIFHESKVSEISRHIPQLTSVNIYYCMTGRAIQGNIQFEGAQPQGGTIHTVFP